MFLSKADIKERLADFFPNLADYDKDNLHEACYDLRVGDEVFLSENRVPTQLPDKDGNPYIVLPPGQFALVKTFERISVPRDCIAFISIRSKFKFQGLINISGFHVDPTYKGHLIFSVQNVGPNDIRLKYKDPAFMIIWAKLQTPYQEEKQRDPGYDRITLEQMAQLGGPSTTLTTLKKELDALSLSMKIYGGLAISGFIALMIIILRRFLE